MLICACVALASHAGKTTVPIETLRETTKNDLLRDGISSKISSHEFITDTWALPPTGYAIDSVITYRHDGRMVTREATFLGERPTKHWVFFALEVMAAAGLLWIFFTKDSVLGQSTLMAAVGLLSIWLAPYLSLLPDNGPMAGLGLLMILFIPYLLAFFSGMISEQFASFREFWKDEVVPFQMATIILLCLGEYMMVLVDVLRTSTSIPALLGTTLWMAIALCVFFLLRLFFQKIRGWKIDHQTRQNA